MKLLYFHIPKTAGSSINNFFSKNIRNYHFHIESVKNLSPDFCRKFQFLSGHVPYNRMSKMLNLNEWITFVTFRDPLSYTLSHLKWVRKLADAGEEKRFNEHPEIFQKIALKMTEFDFSKAQEISSFIKWLESINFYYFHNTQTLYMNNNCNSNIITEQQMTDAIKNMQRINFIGIQENLDEFMEMISYEFGWSIDAIPRENINENNYGFDINDKDTQEVLLPLYEKDLMLYNEAKKLYEIKKVLYKPEAKQNIVGHVDIASAMHIVGWVRSKDSLQKVELELKSNGVVVQTTVANNFRLDLKAKGIHPTGLCGFRFTLDKNTDCESYKIFVKDTSIEIYMPKKAVSQSKHV